MRTHALRRIGGTGLVAVLALASTACSDDKGPTEVGGDRAALLVLETPGTDEGALLFTLEGPESVEFDAVSSSHQIFSREMPDGSLRVVVIGDLAAGAVLALTLSEGQTDEYEATLEQVASRQNALRTSLAGYSLVIEALGD
ncbi:MAG TPA: hypothetical protein VMN78_00450 [Longimicrobiales bacterium]|nr:hypothetical protein [Longimicrobiales bacterium]